MIGRASPIFLQGRSIADRSRTRILYHLIIGIMQRSVILTSKPTAKTTVQKSFTTTLKPALATQQRSVLARMARVETLFLEEGFIAPEFSLPWPEKDFAPVSLMNDVVKADTKAVVFLILSNHCPFVVHLKDEIIRMSQDYKSQGVEFVAISPNDPKIKEKDSAELMAKEGYPFPYLFDEAQEVAKMYKGMCTPDIYAFRNDGGELKLAYQGQLDSSRPERKGGDPNIPNNGEDLRAALDHIVAGESVPKPWKPSIGCSIKWSEGNEPSYWGKQ